VIRIEGSAEGRVRVIGALTCQMLETLLDVLGTGPVVLDLSELFEADTPSIELLARLSETCRVVGCPRWLELWMERERRQRARGRTT
jgi:hypothetical protein